jgi:chorismate--pyruvate lyase
MHWFLPHQSSKRRIDPSILSWLSDQGSLTRRLKQRCPQRFAVDVLGMQWTRPDRGEARLLGIPQSQIVLLREVHLKCADKLCVYARSVIPLKTLSGRHRRLRRLGNKPLGEYLFASPTLERSRIEWAHLAPDNKLFHNTLPQSGTMNGTIWGRRSLFRIDHRPLLVSEFFLPVLFE